MMSKVVDIVIAGRWRSIIHEQPLKEAFENQGINVKAFKWDHYFSPKSDKFFFSELMSRFENKTEYGFTINKINDDLLEYVKENKPDVLFVYRGRLVQPKTLQKLKKECPGTILISYNNDNFESDYYNSYYWKRFKKTIRYYDIIFSYRPSDINAYQHYGAKFVKLLPPWYVKSLNFPEKLTKKEENKYSTDVVFAGHYEDDGRADLFKRLIRDEIKLRLYGPEWEKVSKSDPILKKLDIHQLNLSEYNKAICGAKLAISVYSTLNKDVYTRRCFEIPATKTLMIAKRTNEIKFFFEEDVEAVYFSDYDELLTKIKYYLKHEDIRSRIAKNGYDRAIKDKYDVIGRSKEILNWIKTYQKL